MHEIDVIGIGKRRVTLLGEAKATLARRGVPDLQRLDAVKELLIRKGHDASAALKVLFSATGFTPDLVQAAAARPDVELVNLARLYSGSAEPV